MKRLLIFLGILISLTLLNSNMVFSQEKAASDLPSAPMGNPEPEMQWVWGEVVSVDTASNTITVKYLDYETDAEKQITIIVDVKTTLENIKSLTEIQPKDTVSVDYMAGPEGKSLAKNISVEKPEEAPAAGNGQISNTTEEKMEEITNVTEDSPDITENSTPKAQ